MMGSQEYALFATRPSGEGRHVSSRKYSRAEAYRLVEQLKGHPHFKVNCVVRIASVKKEAT